MSADNGIFLIEWNDAWYVWHGSLSASYYEPESYEHFFETKERALKFAQEYCDKIGYVEGGIIEITKHDQEKAIVEQIQYLSERLMNLIKYGEQNFNKEF